MLSALLSSLKEEILSHVLFHTTSTQVWKELEAMFASSSQARIMKTCIQLANLQKRDMSASDYFHKVKGLADPWIPLGI